MTETIHSITLAYGDALFHLYQFQLNPSTAPQDQVVHGHRFYELHIAQEGAYTYSVGTQQIPVTRNQLLIIPPDIPHASVQTQQPDGYRYTVLSLSLEKQEGEEGFYAYFQQTLDQCALRALPIPAELSRWGAELNRAELYGAIRGSCYLKMQASALIYLLFDSLNGFRSSGMARHGECDEHNRLVLLDTLVNQADRSLSDIASAIHYSPRHTARLIHKLYGVSLSELRKKQCRKERI